jgi:long-chain acyl-CoA synthetase
MLLVHNFLEQSAERTPDKTALVCDGRRLSYAELDAMANRMARCLREHGVGRGDRVLLCLHNSVELVVSIFATLKAGGVFVAVNATTKQDKLLYLVRNCRASALVLQAGQAETARAIVEKADSVRSVVLAGGDGEEGGCDPFIGFGQVQQAYPASPVCCRTIDRDLACLIYTSGSTGDPKGVMSGHDNVVFAASSIIAYLENRPEDVVVNGLPMSFDYGLYQMLMTFKFGGTLVLERSFAYPAKLLRLMEEERVTGLPGVPTLFAILLKMDLSPFDLSSLRYITNTAAALPPSHIRGIRDKFPQARLYSMYGLTETKRTLWLPPDQLDKRPGSVGIAIPGTEVWIENEEGRRLGPGDVGELVVRGGHVMRGYWETPAATAERYRPGPIPGERLCYSGDLFRMDEEGFFYFVGRKDDIIKSRGEKVPPKEVECALCELADVIEAAVVGVDDPILGESIKAFIVLQPGSALTEREVLRHCRNCLVDYMVPQKVEIRESLPKNASGKIQKRELAEEGRRD